MNQVVQNAYGNIPYAVYKIGRNGEYLIKTLEDALRREMEKVVLEENRRVRDMLPKRRNQSELAIVKAKKHIRRLQRARKVVEDGVDPSGNHRDMRREYNRLKRLSERLRQSQRAWPGIVRMIRSLLNKSSVEERLEMKRIISENENFVADVGVVRDALCDLRREYLALEKKKKQQ